MADPFDEKALENLDKQTLIMMLRMSNTSIQALQETVDQLNKQISLLTEEVRGLRQNRFGRKTETKLVEQSDYQQYYFSFNESEITIECEPVKSEPEIEEVIPRAYKRKKRQGKRREDLKDIPKVIVEHTLTDDELLEKFPDGKWKRLPDEIYSRLEFIPAMFQVIEHHVAVYVGSKSKEFVRAPRPADLLRNSIVTPSLMAGIGNYKFANAQPIHRLSKEFEAGDVFIAPNTMCNWTIQCADRYLARLYDRLHGLLYDCHVIHADETPVTVVKDGRPAGSKSYMWVYRAGSFEQHPFVLYEYQKTRKTDHPREFLKNYNGVCVTDGYQVYHTLEKQREGLKIAGCWAHARRGFAETVKTLGAAKAKGTVAHKALALVDLIFDAERDMKSLTPEERLKEREQKTAPLVDAFFDYIRKEQNSVAPKSQTGKAISYCLNQEQYLRVFLTDGMVPASNNAAELSIRTFCLGKKNWYVIDSIKGAKASAIWYSISETAKANGLKVYEYFRYILTELSKHGEFEDPAYIDALLPWSEDLPDICHKKQMP